MKAETFNIISDEVKKNVISRLMDVQPKDKVSVTFANIGSKSKQQRGLQWRWYEDVAKAGIGGKHEDTKEGVDRISKFRWAIPIFKRDGEIFPIIYSKFLETTPSPEMWDEFLDMFVHTEKFTTSQMAEYLDSFEKYYISKGVDLLNPDLNGLNYK